METRPETHPSPNVLRDFCLGKLDDPAAETVLDHLETCSECCEEVAAQSGDTFLDRLRQARRPSNTPAPGVSLSGLAPSQGSRLNSDSPCEFERGAGAGQPSRSTRSSASWAAAAWASSTWPATGSWSGWKCSRSSTRTCWNAPAARNASCARSSRRPSSTTPTSSPRTAPCSVGELLVFAMEYVEGEDLAKLVKERGPLPVVNACYYVQQAALGLQHAFEKKMVHRDIKPQNLILAREGKKHVVKVLDFGLAKVTRETSEDLGADRRRHACWARRTTSPRSRRWTRPMPTSGPTSTAWAAPCTSC